MSTFLLGLGSLAPAAAAGPGVGDQAPDFTLPATTGAPISLGQFRGKRVVLLESYAQRAFFLIDKEGIIRGRWLGTATGWRWIGWSGIVVSTALGSPALGGPASPTAAQLARLDLATYPRWTAPPDFSLRTPEGRIIALAGLRGKVVVLNFWATWCRECRTEMPAFETLHRRFGARGLVVVGVNTREGAAAAHGYARELGLTFPVVLDPDGTVTARYGVIGLPTTFLIGRDGRAVALAVGAREWASTAALDIAETLLAGPRETPP